MSASSSLIAYLHPKYLLSLPERVVRALAAGLGGLVFELTEIGLPRWLRSSRLYQALVFRLLRLSVELVGGVEGVFPMESIAVGELAVRKTLGNVIELASFVAVGWSPLWLLAAASDLTGGTRAYLSLFVAELKKGGWLLESSEIQTIDDLLRSLESSSATMADMVDVPPLKVDELRTSWQLLRQNAGSLPDATQLTNLYKLLQNVAGQEGRSLRSLSGLVATGALRAGFQMGSEHIFDYYVQALRTISAEGWVAYTIRIAKPYVTTARSHFSPGRVTHTERALARFWQFKRTGERNQDTEQHG